MCVSECRGGARGRALGAREVCVWVGGACVCVCGGHTGYAEKNEVKQDQ